MKQHEFLGRASKGRFCIMALMFSSIRGTALVNVLLCLNLIQKSPMLFHLIALQAEIKRYAFSLESLMMTNGLFTILNNNFLEGVFYV